jgi:hypothetical protein
MEGKSVNNERKVGKISILSIIFAVLSIWHTFNGKE